MKGMPPARTEPAPTVCLHLSPTLSHFTLRISHLNDQERCSERLGNLPTVTQRDRGGRARMEPRTVMAHRPLSIQPLSGKTQASLGTDLCGPCERTGRWGQVQRENEATERQPEGFGDRESGVGGKMQCL